MPIEYDLPLPNLIHSRLDRIRGTHGADSAWSDVVVRDSRNLGTVIQDIPGSTRPDESEPAGDEWWMMLYGTATVITESGPVLDMEAGDIELVVSGTRYRVRTTGDASSLRIQVSPPDQPPP